MPLPSQTYGGKMPGMEAEEKAAYAISSLVMFFSVNSVYSPESTFAVEMTKLLSTAEKPLARP